MLRLVVPKEGIGAEVGGGMGEFPRNRGGITGDNAENMEVSSCENYRALVQDSKVVIHASIQHRTLQPFSDVFVVFWLFPSCVSRT